MPEYISLCEAAKSIPGRPSSNCLWRWARRGVAARNGKRVHLRHVRLGGRILTTRQWLDEFGQALAAADAEFFETAGAGVPRRESEDGGCRAPRERTLERIEQELDEAGL